MDAYAKEETLSNDRCFAMADPIRSMSLGGCATVNPMAKYFVRNETNPQPSASVHGTVVDVPNNGDAPAAYAAIHPVANGDILTVIGANLLAFQVTATFAYPMGASPMPPATGT